MRAEGLSWTELLVRLAARVPGDRKEFLRKLVRKAVPRSCGQHLKRIDQGKFKVHELFTWYDKLNLAWHISAEFGTPHDRDKVIADLVEPDARLTRESVLIEEVLRLPFRDIVTTNYDSNLGYFLGSRDFHCCECTAADGRNRNPTRSRK